jgi:hypothetical protein
MWYLNTLHFGNRGGGEEHIRLKWGDIELKRDTNSFFSNPVVYILGHL